MKKIEHIGIAVEDMDAGEKLFEKLLGAPPYKREHVDEQDVLTSFFRVGPNKVELLQSTSESGVIKRFIDKNGPGLHHVAFAVHDIKAEMARLKHEGFKLLNEEPMAGADNKLVCFIHPRTTNKMLIELVQEKPAG